MAFVPAPEPVYLDAADCAVVVLFPEYDGLLFLAVGNAPASHDVIIVGKDVRNHFQVVFGYRHMRGIFFLEAMLNVGVIELVLSP